MNRRTSTITGLITCALISTAYAQPAKTLPIGESIATPEQIYQLALEARTEGNYGAMLDHLRRAARSGDRPARELLASVLIAGPALYGKAVRADYCEAWHWMRLSATQGSTVGSHQLLLINSLREVPGGRKACKPPLDGQ